MTMKKLQTVTNTELCDCGVKHDYAVIDRNIVWYCVTNNDYYVREYVRGYEGHTFDIVENGDLVTVNKNGVALFDIVFSYTVHASQKTQVFQIARAMVWALNRWET